MTLNDVSNPDNQFPSIINLNIGGSIFTTRLTTLQSVPGSMLDTMFSGRHALDKDDQGRYFIDRDGKLFNHILAYLRDPANLSIPIDLIPAVLEEARFYQLTTLIDLLKGHPSMLAIKIVKSYRASLGDKYETMKRGVFASLSKKGPIEPLRPDHTSFDREVPGYAITSPDDPNSQSSYISSYSHTISRSLHTILKTDIRIATPHVSFDQTDSFTFPSAPTQSTTVLRRNHQRPYNACQADGHDFKDIDVVSSFWHKSDVWSLLLHDLRKELNTRVEVKIEQGTPIYCTRCRYQNSYGVCIFSIFWLREEVSGVCSSTEQTFLLESSQNSTD